MRKPALGGALSVGDMLTEPPTEPALDVNARLVQCFVTLAEELHFGRAAEALYVGQPAFSRSIQQLERRLGRRLFTRSTRTVALTPAGAALLPPARELLASLRAATDELAAARGTLRVAHAPGSDTLAILLDRFARRHPQLTVSEATLTANEQRAALGAGELDIAICATDEPGFAVRPLRLDPLLVAVVGRDPNVRRPVDVRRRVIAVPEDRDLAPVLAQYEQAVGFRAQRVAVASGSGTEAYALRRAGARAFLWLASRRTALDATLVGALPLQAYVQWNLVHRRPATPAVRAFLDVAEDVSAAEGWLRTDSLAGEPWLAGGQACSQAA